MVRGLSLNLIKIKGLKFNAENTKKIRAEEWKGRRLVLLHPSTLPSRESPESILCKIRPNTSGFRNLSPSKTV